MCDNMQLQHAVAIGALLQGAMCNKHSEHNEAVGGRTHCVWRNKDWESWMLWITKDFDGEAYIIGTPQQLSIFHTLDHAFILTSKTFSAVTRMKTSRGVCLVAGTLVHAFIVTSNNF